MKYEECINLLKVRGVALEDIADIVVELQINYHPEITREKCLTYVKEILEKREVQFAIITGINIDIACDENKLQSESLKDALKSDYSLYGVDEVLAYGICNLYGSIALTNFGYVDKLKPGVIGELNSNKNQCNTFIDDIVGAIAAAAASKIAHEN